MFAAYLVEKVVYFALCDVIGQVAYIEALGGVMLSAHYTARRTQSEHVSRTQEHLHRIDDA